MATNAACDLVAEFGASGTLNLNNPGVLFYYAFGNTSYDITLSHGPTAVQLSGGNNKFTLADGMYLSLLQLGNGNDTVVTGVGTSWGATIDTIHLGGGTNSVTMGSGGIGRIQAHAATNTITTNGAVSQIQTSASVNTIHVGGTGLGVEDMHLYGSNMELQTITIELWVDTLVCGSGTVADITVMDGGLISYARTGHNADVFDLGNGFIGSLDMKNGDDLLKIEGGDANFLFMRGGDDTVRVTDHDGTQGYMFNGGDGSDTLNFTGSKVGVNISEHGLAVRNFETIIGTAKGDVIFDGNGDTVIKGGKGGDVIAGGGGRDLLYGGTGIHKDVFVFEKTSDSHKKLAQTDRVFQFSAKDKLDLSGIDADTTTAGEQSFAFTGKTATAHSVWFETKSGKAFVHADVNGDANADFSILIMNTSTVNAQDFIL